MFRDRSILLEQNVLLARDPRIDRSPTSKDVGGIDTVRLQSSEIFEIHGTHGCTELVVFLRSSTHSNEGAKLLLSQISTLALFPEALTNPFRN